MIDLKQFILKSKLVIYTKIFVELYNESNNKQVDKILKMIEFEMICVLTIKNGCNYGAYQIIEISLILYSIYMILKNQEKFIFCVNNYIYQDYFNKLIIFIK